MKKSINTNKKQETDSKIESVIIKIELRFFAVTIDKYQFHHR